MGTRRGVPTVTIPRFLFILLKSWCCSTALKPGQQRWDGGGGINFCLKSDACMHATILAAWLFIHDTGRFLPISASLPATLEESSTSLARMETSPFSTGFHNHHPEGNLNNAAMLQPIATRTQVLELGPFWFVLVRPGLVLSGCHI